MDVIPRENASCIIKMLYSICEVSDIKVLSVEYRYSRRNFIWVPNQFCTYFSLKFTMFIHIYLYHLMCYT